MSTTVDPVPVEKLRWICPIEAVPGESTDDIAPIEGIVAQDEAMEALRFGLEIDAPGQNIFVRGLAGTGRLTLVRDVLTTIEPRLPPAPDHVYVHDFDRPDSPKLITFPRGKAEPFRQAMEDFRTFLGSELEPAMHAEEAQAARARLETRWQEEIEQITAPFEEELARAGLALALVKTGELQQPVILPVIDGEAVPPDKLQALVASGQLDAGKVEEIAQRVAAFRPKLIQTHARVADLRRKHRAELKDLLIEQARDVLTSVVAGIAGEFPEASDWLEDVVDDVARRRLDAVDLEDRRFLALYEVNVIAAQRGSTRPVIIENAPTIQALLGRMEIVVGPEGLPQASHMSLHAGSLLHADGGYVIMEARDVLTEPGAWLALIRTLRSGKIELTPPEGPTTLRVSGLKPQPIPVRVKVVLIGDAGIYHLLDNTDPDFPHQFKVLADFDTVVPREPRGVRYYAGVLSRIVREERLPRIRNDAIAALVEHGARIAARADMVTTRFGRVADIAREAGYLARRQGEDMVTAQHVWDAVARTKRRADLPGRRFREQVASGLIRISTQDAAVGQINGLAVIQAGPLTYGMPTRITATVGAGRGGTVNIEREAMLSGAIHTKSFYILNGLMRSLLRADHPLTFDASLAFEQSYGGIDGDSASAAELVCLLSALTNAPIRQDLAMTGAVDQVGNILPVGAVNEKIEGFYDTCVTQGLTGTQGVLIPASNTGDLMLRHDVVEDCAAGRFHVYAVSRIEEALALFTGMEPGTIGPDGRFPPGTLLERARMEARRYWEMLQDRPEVLP